MPNLETNIHIYTIIDSNSMIVENYDFNFEKASKFYTTLQNILSVYKTMYDRKVLKNIVIFQYFCNKQAGIEEGDLGGFWPCSVIFPYKLMMILFFASCHFE